MLNKNTYKKLNKDPTSTQEAKVTRKLKDLERSGELGTNLYHRLRPKGSKPPLIYGLPKVHKLDVPLRPIVSCIGSPTYDLSKYISKIISPLAGSSDSFVKDSKHFVDGMKDVRLCSDEVMVSLDVKSLFTNVPVQEAVEVVYKKLKEDETLIERTSLSAERVRDLLQMCLSSTYFSYEGVFYEQLDGAAMGSPVSAVMANLFMEFFENLALSTSPVKPSMWKRYVDDILCFLKKGGEKDFLDHINGIN